MNEPTDNLNYYKDVDVADIFGVSVVSVKNWRRTGQLKFEQKAKGHSVKISKRSIDMFVREHAQYKRRWSVNKK
jgi:uncharacterized protein YjcR